MVSGGCHSRVAVNACQQESRLHTARSTWTEDDGPVRPTHKMMAVRLVAVATVNHHLELQLVACGDVVALRQHHVTTKCTGGTCMVHDFHTALTSKLRWQRSQLQ
jgi:hypothetical protein